MDGFYNDTGVMKNLIIVGADGFGREVLQWVKDINKVQKRWNIKGFIDDDLSALDRYECEYSIIGTIEAHLPDDKSEYVCAISSPDMKENSVNLLKSKGAVFTSIVHPTAIISTNAVIGEGIILSPYVVLNDNVKIGKFTAFFPLSCVGHDAEIGSFCTISSHCDVPGGVIIENKVYLGSCVTIAPKRRIGIGAYVGTGSVVITNIKTKNRVAGNPAKKIDF